MSVIPHVITRHSMVVRVSHWLMVFSVFALAISGTFILTSHPRLYWGETGNMHEQPWLVLPIPSSRRSVPTLYNFRIPDQNGWSRYLHFEAAWILVLTGLAYGLWGLFSEHFRRNLVPSRGERNWRVLSDIIKKYVSYFVHGKPLIRGDETRYNPLQRVTYLFVIFLLFPLVIASGLAMSPYFAAACPALVELFGGRQTARSLHFLSVSALLGFAVVHIILVRTSGFLNLVRGMTTGDRMRGQEQ